MLPLQDYIWQYGVLCSLAARSTHLGERERIFLVKETQNYLRYLGVDVLELISLYRHGIWKRKIVKKGQVATSKFFGIAFSCYRMA